MQFLPEKISNKSAKELFEYCQKAEQDYRQLLSGKHLSPVKRICVFEHSVMTNFNCAFPAIQKGQGSGFLFEGSS